LTVAEALDLSAESSGASREVSVRGFVLAAPGQPVRLCTGLAGSFPPQCGNPALELDGFDLALLTDRDDATGVAWSGQTTITGALSGSRLTIGGDAGPT
jgi:hypothetical protein